MAELKVWPEKCNHKTRDCIQCYFEGKIPYQPAPPLPCSPEAIIVRERIEQERQKHSEQEHSYVNAHYGRIGRPKVLPDQHCKECGKVIDVRPYRRKQGRGNYCRECSNKLVMPPKPVWKDGKRIRKEAALQFQRK